ncbi:TIGR02234 family membrane protein [Nocardia sp. NPDC052254]|uniref:TIGR02234 family membrane protein n=1 Tax=Nocardia sp. NPDC052254 TaxID=3155681 RepID=UPI00341D588A
MTNSEPTPESESAQQNSPTESEPADSGVAATTTPAAGGIVRPDDEGDGGTPPAAPSGGRARPVFPVVLLALGAIALWGSSRMTWVTLRSSDGLTEPRTQHLDGGLWFGALTPLALVLVASIAAVFATKGWLRRVVGVVVALVGAVTVIPGAALLSQHAKIAERAATLAELPARAHVDVATASAFPAVLSVIGAVAAFVAGVLLARMPETAARMSGKYDNPVFRRAAAAEEVAGRRRADTTEASAAPEPTSSPEPGELSQRVLWDALDAGADPTDDEPRAGRHTPPSA